MQTFLPYPSFARSAAVLDDRRLGKQRVEALQILRALHLEDYGWAAHPAVLMWRGHTRALVAYGLAVVDEWRGRGHADTTRRHIAEFARPESAVTAAELADGELPPWLGWSRLHRSHQAALVRKDPAIYAPLFPDTSSGLAYVWPEPPADPPPRQPFTAWAVRATTAPVLAAFDELGVVGVPARLGAATATRKQRRQHSRFVEVLQEGETVVVPASDTLRCGVLQGSPIERTVRDVAHVARAVAWAPTLPRAILRRPYQLQDPQWVFALRGERTLSDRCGGTSAHSIDDIDRGV